MNEFGITEKSYRLIMEAFPKFSGIEEVLVFGSRAMGNYKTGSDIDFAIKGKQASNRVAWDISGYLNESLPIPYYIDVVYYDALTNPELKEQIDRYGKLFYSRPAAFTPIEAGNTK